MSRPGLGGVSAARQIAVTEFFGGEPAWWCPLGPRFGESTVDEYARID
jgi:hypothetical protein